MQSSFCLLKYCISGYSELLVHSSVFCMHVGVMKSVICNTIASGVRYLQWCILGTFKLNVTHISIQNLVINLRLNVSYGRQINLNNDDIKPQSSDSSLIISSFLGFILILLIHWLSYHESNIAHQSSFYRPFMKFGGPFMTVLSPP